MPKRIVKTVNIDKTLQSEDDAKSQERIEEVRVRVSKGKGLSESEELELLKIALGSDSQI